MQFNIEVERAVFEEWYADSGRDRHAKWHPAESLTLDKHLYPNGRYTIWSEKQAAWEVWQAAKISKNKVPERPLLIALDYDGTYTADPDMWLSFVEFAIERGHEVVVATMRTNEELDDLCEKLCSVVNRIIPTHRNAKRAFLESFGIEPDIWIDDQPNFIMSDARDADKTKTAQALLGAYLKE